MINQVKLNNFGPLADINWSGLGKINLVIGGNGSGKTFLLKAIYATTPHRPRNLIFTQNL